MLDCCNLSLWFLLKPKVLGIQTLKTQVLGVFFCLFKMNIFLMLISLFMCN